MCVGHNFTGNYLVTNPAQQAQTYLDQVNVFNVKVNGFNGVNSLAILPVSTITDGLPDSQTTFHRRDLVVAPNVLANGTDIGLAIYGGVFTYQDTIANAGNPFSHPIYIDYTKTPAFRVDTFNQWTNIYSTAFLSMYDAGSKSMITSLFGGLGDTKANFTSANWTNVISSNIRSYANNGDITTSTQNPNVLPGYIGSESVFIPTVSANKFYNSDYKIIDYSKLETSEILGYIYGGITSNQCCNDTNGSTIASNKLYAITINKTQATTEKK